MVAAASTVLQYVPAPHPGLARTRPAEDRFYEYLRLDLVTGCFVWTRRCDRDGYGRLTIHGAGGQRVCMPTHRFAWTVTFGQIPEGLSVCHECDNPPCCNPSHLFLGTNQQNTADKVAKGRQAAGEGNFMAKLTEVQVIEIRSRLTGSELSHRQLAREYGVHPSTIDRIALGATWKRGAA